MKRRSHHRQNRTSQKNPTGKRSPGATSEGVGSARSAGGSARPERAHTARATSAAAPRIQSRPAEGREKELRGRAAEPFWARLALDAIARHRASQEPLERSVDAVLRAARAGRRERGRAGDAAFAWARSRHAAERVVEESVAAYGGVPPSRRDRDRAALMLAELAAGVDMPAGPLPAPLTDLIEMARDAGVATVMPVEQGGVPPWLATRLAEAYGDRAPALLRALAEPAPLVVAVDERHVRIDDVRARLTQAGGTVTPSPVSPGALRVAGRLSLQTLPVAMRAHVWPMDDGSQAVVQSLGVQRGERILDLCAGGGGKTKLLTALGAYVTAVDIDRRRLHAARDRCPEAQYLWCDGTRAPFADASFDKVLVDAPCSGTGTLRRAPDLAARLRSSQIEDLVPTQTRLLEEAARLVKPGGVVVYATCSLLPDENDKVVEQARSAGAPLEEAPLLELRGYAEDTARPGFPPQQMLLPSETGTDGFFIARLRRRRADETP